MKREYSNEEISCENYFRATTRYSTSGRYVVYLPFRSIFSDNTLPDLNVNNAITAFKRLRQMEISFSKNPTFAIAYKHFMQEYELLGHMTRIGTYPNDVRDNSYFLPHQGVFKESSTTTRLRVMFDGSSHLKDCKSLNEELCPGPALQNDLASILTTWRKHKIGFSADIEKMFRQIDVKPEHRKYQQILWLNSFLKILSQNFPKLRKF